MGRAGELELFRAALEGPEASWGVLFVHGPGGVGKTALLEALADVAEQARVPAWRVDLRDVEVSPPGFLAAVAGALGVPDGARAVAALGSPGRRVLLMDTYEWAAGLDRWVRERFLPGLGGDTLVVIAGRDAPSRGWLEDAGWRELLRVVALRNLPPSDARALLAIGGRRRSSSTTAVLELTHGHPLALSLLVDVLDQRGVRARARSTWAARRTWLGALLERFVAGVPSAASPAGAGGVRALARDDRGSAADGAGGRGRGGAVRVVARAVVRGGGRRRAVPARPGARRPGCAICAGAIARGYADVHRRVRRHVVAGIRAGAGREQQRAAADLHFLHRGNRRDPRLL